MICARKRTLQRLFSRDQLRVVKREATPQLDEAQYSASSILSLINAVLFLDVFGVDRVRATVQNWVHKAD